MASRWLSASVDADPLERARLLRQAHAAVFNGRGRPGIVRELVLDSWLRSVDAGVDPTRPAPRIISEREAAEQLSSDRLGGIVPIVRQMLGGVACDARHIVVISDAAGLLLLAEGHPEMLEAAAANHFVPGALLSENAAGTNAIGTTLYLDHPLQIFSAEHFKSLFHGWTCSAAPIHDPVSGALLGAIDLSGNFRTAHPHSVSLVTAVARLVETRLALDAAQPRCAPARPLSGARHARLAPAERARDDVGPRAGLEPAVVARRDVHAARRRRPVHAPVGRRGGARAARERRGLPALEGRSRPSGAVAPDAPDPRARPAASGARADRRDGRAEPSPQRDPHVARAALRGPHRRGARARDLRRQREGGDDPGRGMSRLRRLLGCLLLAHPYRLLADVEADFLDVARLVRTGDLCAAAGCHPGPLLARSRVPGIVAERERLERALRDRGRPAREEHVRLEGPAAAA